jgi:heptose-I-phosphate ethanolaminephosphotransferase
MVFTPIKTNAAFFVFMYLLGLLCTWETLPHQKGATIYEHTYAELFLDIYLLCLILTAIPQKVRTWVKGFLYFILYSLALIDVYCFVKFQSTITPTMLLLVGETDSREAGDFLRSYLSADVIFSPVGWILLLILVHIAKVFLPRLRAHLSYRNKIFLQESERRSIAFWKKSAPLWGTLSLCLLVYSAIACAHNKAAMCKLMSGSTIGEVEHTLTEKDHANLYMPIYRLVFSIYANELASQQITRCIEAANHIQVDSCSYRSPNIVLIIGESYGRQHDQQYGYFMPTTPRQIKREKSGLLVKFTDVVAPWNLTSFVFKNVLSMHVVGQKGEWCDYPLFPELFRKAGYHVTFITNQFLPQAKEAVYDFSGGFFLNNPTLSKAQFDSRNTRLYRYDAGLIKEYDDSLKKLNKEHNLIIFHLIGQHVNYRQRYPNDRRKFTADDYVNKRPELNDKQRRILADYDNAVLYNDSIVDQIVKRFENQDAIVIYMPDHGEECYEGNRGFICRNHSADIDWELAHYEFQIPFWIYCSHQYAVKHPEIYQAIVQARKRKFMTDALPHLLVYLAGIHTPSYHATYNVISPDYDENRPRILKGTTDYDKLKPKK